MSSAELNRRPHAREVVRLAELANSRSFIENEAFEDCEILGPAMIVPLSDFELRESTLGGPPDAVFYEVPDDRTMVGVIAVRNVSIRGCRMHNVGIMGTKASIAKLRQGLV